VQNHDALNTALRRAIKDRSAILSLSVGKFTEMMDFSAVGRLAINFNLLDQHLLYLAITLLGFRDPSIGMELLKTWSTDQKASAIKTAIARYQELTVFDPEVVQSFLGLLSDITVISRERNRWIHGFCTDAGGEEGKWVLEHPKWTDSLILDCKQIFPLLDRILDASRRLGDFAEVAEERLQIVNAAIRRFEDQEAMEASAAPPA